VGNFGQLIRTLRLERGLSQESLGEIAGVSDFTIRRAEGRPDCVWKRSTATAVLTALAKVAPLSEAEAEQYVEAAGLTRGMAAALEVTKPMEAVRDVVAGGRPVQNPARGLRPSSRTEAPNAKGQTAHAYLDRLIEEKGAANVVKALQGVAAAWDIDLPPETTQDDLARPETPVWMLVISDETTDDGYRVRQFAPAVPAQAPHKAPPIDTGRRRAAE
jgi:transcriptional regulator with XRE-family HTH domain